MPRSLPRAAVALLMLVVLCLGTAGHAWHHVVDRDCDARPGAAAHPCDACAGLHAATTEAVAHVATLEPPRPAALLECRATQRPLSALSQEPTSRGPPAR